MRPETEVVKVNAPELRKYQTETLIRVFEKLEQEKTRLLKMNEPERLQLQKLEEAGLPCTPSADYRRNQKDIEDLAGRQVMLLTLNPSLKKDVARHFGVLS